MKIDLLTKKEGFYTNQKDIVALLKLIPDMGEKVNKKAKMNLSFVLDNSGSMDKRLDSDVGVGVVNNPFNQFHLDVLGKQPKLNPWDQPCFVPNLDNLNNLEADNKTLKIAEYLNHLRFVQETQKTRFSLVVEATKSAINMLDENDFASIVLFSDNVDLIFPACAMTAENKLKAMFALNNAKTKGMTDLNAGWISGVEEVSKNLANDYINRVILLTDGVANVGETNPEKISSYVANASRLSVSTSTIGVGLDFNEFLLQAMSSSGSGNSYFIDSSESVRTTFDMEFTGLSNTVAQEIKVKVKTSKDIALVKNLNMYQQEDGYFKLPNLSGSLINSVFVFESVDKKMKSLSSIEFEINYKDRNGNKKILKTKKQISLVSKAEYDNLEENQEVKVQELLNSIAEQKVQAQKEYKIGNLRGAKDLLARSVMETNAVAASIGDEYKGLLQTEALNLNMLKDEASVAGNEKFSKTLSYQSYITRNSQE